MMVELIVLALTMLVAPLGGYWLKVRYRAWSGRRAALLGALPLPGVLLSLAVLLAVGAWADPGVFCGTDACASAWALAITGAVLAAVVFLVGIPLAAFGVFLANRNGRHSKIASEFE